MRYYTQKRDFAKKMLFLLICLALLSVPLSTGEKMTTFHVLEEMPADTVAGDVGDQLRHEMNEDEFSNLQFKLFQSADSQNKAVFYVTHDGLVKTSSVIDREEMCKFSTSCVETFDVVIYSLDSTYFHVIKVTIYIDDVNDNMPIFPQKAVKLNIMENTMVGTSFILPAAIDMDTGRNNSVLTYTLTPRDSSFTLNVSHAEGRISNVALGLADALDRESRDSYRFDITACDGGSPRRCGKLPVDVSVDDVNDNMPTFSKKLYHVTVNETLSEGSTLLVLTAHDADIGENGKVIYSLSQNQPDKVLNAFNISKTSGVLSLSSSVKFKSIENHKVLITASDKGNPPLVSHTTVLIHIKDSNNNPPEVQINPLFGDMDGSISLSESTKVGTLIAHVSVEDSDMGENGMVTCIIKDPQFRLAKTRSSGYKLILNSPLDREVMGQKIVSVYCSDKGRPPNKVNNAILIKIKDENDNAPKFQKKSYTINIYENNQEGAPVLKVIATDKDTGNNANITFKIVGEERMLFDINRFGIMKAKCSFDREAVANYNVTVVACDNGSPPLESNITVFVNIIDINDHAPEFTQSIYIFYVLENQPKDTFVGIVVARDYDDKANGEVFYMFNELTESVPFKIDEGGRMKTTNVLDRESKQRYEISVIAKDRGAIPLSTSVSITIYVLDVNDNRPVISFPNDINDTAVTEAPNSPKTWIVKIKAHDDDDGLNSKLFYSIVGRDYRKLFDIEPESGVIYFKRLPKMEDGMEFKLNIGVSDLGSPAQKATAILFISVVKVHNEPLAVIQEESTDNYAFLGILLLVITSVIVAGVLVIVLVTQRMDRRRTHKVRFDTEIF